MLNTKPSKARQSGAKALSLICSKKARVILEYDVEELMAKDSKFLSEKDREKIIEKCISAKEDRIIITHGAYTMALTAKKLGKAGIGKTIVLTGSMIPANKPESDALFNLGKALGVVQTLPTGVYIAMNGRVFNWQNVKKNARSGSFEEEK